MKLFLLNEIVRKCIQNAEKVFMKPILYIKINFEIKNRKYKLVVFYGGLTFLLCRLHRISV